MYFSLANLKKIVLTISVLCACVSPLAAEEAPGNSAIDLGYVETKTVGKPRASASPAVATATGAVTAPVGPAAQGLSALLNESRVYRQKGLELQTLGDLEGAMSWYQKAIEFDPTYVLPYNDLGILFEAKGMPERAEEMYLKAITVDPSYLSAYSNLALLYENLHKLDKAMEYWQERADRGLPDDPWTIKARKRIIDIKLVEGQEPVSSKEQQVIGLIDDVLQEKYLVANDNRQLAEMYFRRARLSYKRGAEVVAYRQALDAFQLDPTNPEIQAFIEKLHTRQLSR